MSTYLTRAEVAQWLKTSTRTIDRWRTMRLNPIPHMKIGGSVRFGQEAVEQWLRTKRRGVYLK